MSLSTGTARAPETLLLTSTGATASVSSTVTLSGADSESEEPLQEPSPSIRSEEHTSELQSLMRTPYAVFWLKKKKNMCCKTHSKLPHTRRTTNDDLSKPLKCICQLPTRRLL